RSLHTVDTRRPAHAAVGALAHDFEDHFLDPSQHTRRVGDRLELEPVACQKTLIHPIQVGGKERSLVSARTGTKLDDRVAIVQRIAGNDEWLELLLELPDAVLEARELGAGLVRHLGVVNENELANLRELVIVFAKP